MEKLIDAAVSRSRTVLLLLVMILILGMSTYLSVPKEMEPDIQIPIFYISLNHEGISPEDAERLLLRPLEKTLRAVEGLKEIRGQANEGHASLTLEFHAGFNSDKALQDVRVKVDEAKPDLPVDTEEPVIKEINLSEFPVLNVILRGVVPERTMLNVARQLRDKIESIPAVLSVNIAGNREEVLDIVVDPVVLEGYHLSPPDIISFVKNNHALVSAGKLERDHGSFSVKLRGLLENIQQFYELPVRMEDEAILTIKDIADVKYTYKDATGYARVNGEPAVVLEVSKRTGTNMIDTIEAVRALVTEEQQYWPDSLQVMYAQDRSNQVKERLQDLQNNIILAVLLVLFVIMKAMGKRPSLLVAITIPGSFLFGIAILGLMGMTMNIVVLFSLILSIGMLVDAAIVVSEYANRRMMAGESHTVAYPEAAKRMAWPIISSTVTTLIVFMPLLVWPGIVGKFMQYMPLTMIIILGGSLLMALVFMPVLGVLLGKTKPFSPMEMQHVLATENGTIEHLGHYTKKYAEWLRSILQRPGRFVGITCGVMLFVFVYFAMWGTGSEFFPNIEPDNLNVTVHARGNLSVKEKDTIVREVESRIAGLDGIKILYARSGASSQSNAAEDQIGSLTLELEEWGDRSSAAELIEEMTKRTEDIAGINLQMLQQKPGPSQGKPFNVELRSRYPDLLLPAVKSFRSAMDSVGGFVNVEDSTPVEGIEWQLKVNRTLAGRYGLTVRDAGNYVKLVTNGVIATTYRPDDTDDEVDIRVRFPESYRTLDEIDRLKVTTPLGAVPLSNFMTREPFPTVGRLERVDGMRTYTVQADMAEGVLLESRIQAMTAALKQQGWDPRVEIKFRGEQEDKQETASFLANAFLLALFGMLLVMVTQFNSIYYGLIVMSAVFFSTGGVLIGLLITGLPFGVVMGGVGIIALAGIVVNNNIIFIDTYQVLRKEGINVHDALLLTGIQRLRPILLTAGTTVLGLLPMVFQLSVDFIGLDVSIGAPSSQWWVQLSTTIAGGLAFSTILTLFLTPSLIMLGNRFNQRYWQRIH